MKSDIHEDHDKKKIKHENNSFKKIDIKNY